MGLFYGDEGKGTTVDFLAREYKAELVVRFNGGPQAAHNVVTEDGRWHCFAQFGAGSFVPGTKTLLSRFMIINPHNLLTESKVLIQHGVPDGMDRIYIDKRCFIATPMHKLIGNLCEMARGEVKHGSCGMGVGIAALEIEQIKTEGKDPYEELFPIGLALDEPEKFRERIDKHRSNCLEKARQVIKEYTQTKTYNSKMKTNFKFLSKDVIFSQNTKKKLDAHLATFEAEYTTDLLFTENRSFVLDHKDHIVDGTTFLKDILLTKKNVIFEGAQGALLDRQHGFYPFVTKTGCSVSAAQTLLKETEVPHKQTKMGILRTYSHRHGAGPFVTEVPLTTPFGRHCVESHNSNNQWQGPMRIGHFDLPAIRYAVAVAGGVDCLSLTHLDYLKTWTTKKEAWPVCLTYEYTGKDLPTAKKYLEIVESGNPVKNVVKSIIFDKDRRLNDPTLSNLLKDCVPLHLMSIKASPPEAKVLDGATNQLLMILKNQLQLSPLVLSFGQRSSEKMIYEQTKSA